MLCRMTLCALCDEPIAADDISFAFADQRRGHRECMARSALGGIGHIENHARWCVELGDPDGGRTYRQSALEVFEWIQTHDVASV